MSEANMRAALLKAVGWFEDYEKQHRAKNTPDANIKANVNAIRAAELRAAAACDHDWVKTPYGASQMLVCYECIKCGDEYEKDVS